MSTQEEDEQLIAQKLELKPQAIVKQLPLYAASLCSEEWLDTVESYQDDPETLRFVLSDFCSKHRHLLCDCGACDSCSEEQTGRPHRFPYLFSVDVLSLEMAVIIEKEGDREI